MIMRIEHGFQYLFAFIAARIFPIDEILFSEGPISRFISQYQFTLTCISHNGPPTNVTWYRDGQEVSSAPFSTSSVLVSPTRTIYHNMLTVMGRMEGNYMCTVENTFYSVSAEIDLAGDYICMYKVQVPVSVLVTVHTYLGDS